MMDIGQKKKNSINPETKKEEIVYVSKYFDDAVKKLGNNIFIRIYVNGRESALDNRIAVGDKLSLAYVAQMPN